MGNDKKNQIVGFKIPGCLMTLNEYTRITRGNRYASANAKTEQEMRICAAIRKHLKGWKTDKPVWLTFIWVEKNCRKDKDNIAFAKKFIQDALVKCGTIRGDGWHDVIGFHDHFVGGVEDPHVQVWIQELDE